MAISVCQVFEGGQRRVIGQLAEDVIYVGREPPRGGLTVDSKAVSREHAVFIKVSDHWFFKDLGSSNGSWLNGQHVNAGVPYIVRVNDSIQLADSMIKLVGDPEYAEEAPAVVAFSRGDFIGVFPVPEVGKVVSIGGAAGDLKLDVDFGELPIVVLEKRSNFVCAFPVKNDNKAQLNEQPLTQLVQLQDRDRVTVNPYTLVLSIPSAARLDALGSDNIVKYEELRETFAGWDEKQKPVGHSIFGQFSHSQEDSHEKDNDSESSSQTIVSELRAGGRSDKRDGPVDLVSLIEERIVFILGFAMVGVILALFLWWFLR